MTIIDDAFLQTQVPLILQLEVGPERTLLLVSEFVSIAPSTLEEAEVYPSPEVAKRRGEAAASTDHTASAHQAAANDPGCCGDAECSQLSGGAGVDIEKEVREEEKSKKGLNEIVWLLKLYEKRYKEVILRERVASVKVSFAVRPLLKLSLTHRSSLPRSCKHSDEHARPPIRSGSRSLRSASSLWADSQMPR